MSSTMNRPKKLTLKPKHTTLLIDGENLLKIGFFANQGSSTENGTVKTIFHFINTIRKFYVNHAVTKVIVFWEGEHSRDLRRSYYPQYKLNRKGFDDDVTFDLNRQRARIQQYMEELFIRQVIIDECEGDDGIALYCKMAINEKKIILSSDRDLLQLLDENTSCYLSNRQILITPYNFKNFFEYHYKNVGVIKMISGDTADNICGITGVGEKTVLKLFPEIQKKEVTLNWIRSRCAELLKENPKNNPAKRIVEGKTKYNEYGSNYFDVMNKIINLNDPIVGSNSREIIHEYINSPIDPTGRGGVHSVYKMLVKDGIDHLIPKSDDGFYGFWSTFITIINKEKDFYNGESHVI